MDKFFRNLMFLLVVAVIALIVGMIAPGEWLSNRKQDVNSLYNKMIRFRNTPIAQDFTPDPFNLQIVHLENTEGQLETYLTNSEKGEMLPILHVEGSTQVGKVEYRIRGLGEEGRTKIQDIFESVRDEGSSALEKALKLFGN